MVILYGIITKSPADSCLDKNQEDRKIWNNNLCKLVSSNAWKYSDYFLGSMYVGWLLSLCYERILRLNTEFVARLFLHYVSRKCMQWNPVSLTIFKNLKRVFLITFKSVNRFKLQWNQQTSTASFTVEGRISEITESEEWNWKKVYRPESNEWQCYRKQLRVTIVKSHHRFVWQFHV